MITLRNYINSLQKIDPKYWDLPVIYTRDDEGNSYHKVNSHPDLVEVENLDEYYLEMVWEEDGEIMGTNFNAVIIN